MAPDTRRTPLVRAVPGHRAHATCAQDPGAAQQRKGWVAGSAPRGGELRKGRREAIRSERCLTTVGKLRTNFRPLAGRRLFTRTGQAASAEAGPGVVRRGEEGSARSQRRQSGRPSPGGDFGSRMGEPITATWSATATVRRSQRLRDNRAAFMRSSPAAHQLTIVSTLTDKKSQVAGRKSRAMAQSGIDRHPRFGFRRRTCPRHGSDSVARESTQAVRPIEDADDQRSQKKS